MQVPIVHSSHSVRFFENEEDACRMIAEYFTEDARLDDHCIMLARPATLAGVRRILASLGDRDCGTLSISDRICFVDADASLSEFMRGEELDREHAEEFCMRLLSQVPAGSKNARVKLYGELADVLCARGDYANAVQSEDFTGLLFAVEPRLSILCGYRIGHLGGEAGAATLRAACGKHSDVGPLRDPIGAVYGRAEETAPPGLAPGEGVSSPVVYIVDDDASMRRSLARLVTLSNWRVRTFESAEAFLEDADVDSNGCLVADIQLGGMTGLELVLALAARGLRLPVIAMSGLHDERVENEAKRLGVRVFLQKPFEPQLLLDAIILAVRRPERPS